jgi:erythritol transport system ATP-binding protein
MDRLEQTSSNGSEIVMLAEKITKRYPGTLALDEVDFKVYKGAVNVLIGENGAGRVDADESPSRRGAADVRRVLLDGVQWPCLDARGRESGIGIIFRNSRLFPNLSIAENHLCRPRNDPRRDCSARRAGRSHA